MSTHCGKHNAETRERGRREEKKREDKKARRSRKRKEGKERKKRRRRERGGRGGGRGRRREKSRKKERGEEEGEEEIGGARRILISLVQSPYRSSMEKPCKIKVNGKIADSWGAWGLLGHPSGVRRVF